MMSLVIGAAMCISFVVNSLSGNLYLSTHLVKSEYTILNASERCYNRVLECESVESVDRLYYEMADYESGVNTNFISVSDVTRWVTSRSG